MIIFFHIPKCAGSTIEEAFSARYPNSVKFPATVLDYLISPPDIVMNKHSVLAGHITHDTALPYINQDTILITLLRNPIARVRSAYNYFSQINDNSKLNLASSHLAFEDWLYSDIPEIKIQIQNAMIRQFTPESYWDTSRSACPELIRHQACKFISRFNLVGVLEKLPEFSEKLQLLTGINIKTQAIVNKSKKDNTRHIPDHFILNWLEKESSHDLFFYNYVLTKISH